MKSTPACAPPWPVDRMFDVVIVGARCAGASTALLLARRGHQVLLVDRSTFPSDVTLSTHLVFPPGVAKLTSWGLGEQLAATGVPPLSTAHFDLGPFALDGTFPPAGAIAHAYAPRRLLLDRLLVEAATAAGAQLWEATKVDALLTEADGTVTGVSGTARGGNPVSARGRLVVGADGTHSMVARTVRATEYHTCPPLAGTYFSYWSGVDTRGVEFYPRTARAVYGWATNDNLSLVGANWTAADFPAVRTDIEGNYYQVLSDAAPELSERVRAGTREAKWIGGIIRSYFRTPYGPGWALVGDAGYQKDPGTAQGITDALSHAELLATAIDEGLTGQRPMTDALAHYARTRDQQALPMYQLTCALGALAPPTEQMQQFYNQLAGDLALTEQFLGVFAGTVPVAELFPDMATRPAAAP
jgi:flavin-dependent dehydrogenase